jgi:hypothetical protein
MREAAIILIIILLNSAAQCKDRQSDEPFQLAAQFAQR